MTAQRAFIEASSNKANSQALLEAAEEARLAAEKLEALLSTSPPADEAEAAKIKESIEKGHQTFKKIQNQIFFDEITPQIEQAHAWIAELSDPEYPEIGKEFIKRYEDAAFRVVADRDLKCTAAYSSYSFATNDPGFINQIILGEKAATNTVRLFNADTHEALHGMQLGKCAALNADPFSEGTITIKTTDETGAECEKNVSIVICPEDWILLQERCEQDAYTKQAWLNSLLLEKMPETPDGTESLAAKTTDFNDFRRQSNGDLKTALRATAQKARAAAYFSDAPDGAYRYSNKWQDVALVGYRAALDQRNKENIVFVRISPEDVYDIGESFGPNTFSDDPADPLLLTPTTLLTEANNPAEHSLSPAEKLNNLNKDFNIPDKSALPTLREYLKQHGLTPADFITLAQRKPASPPVLTVVTPDAPMP